jgi:predicted RNase H-like nuclease (RuvC/YqgF family)
MTGNGAMRPENEGFMEAEPITEQRHSMHLTMTKAGKEALYCMVIEANQKTIESQEREIETLKGQVSELRAENTELKRRLSLSHSAMVWRESGNGRLYLQDEFRKR